VRDQSNNENTDASIPWARHPPIIDSFTQQPHTSLLQSALVILMRPQVINDEVPDAWGWTHCIIG
jgi:hypothetical protein